MCYPFLSVYMFIIIIIVCLFIVSLLSFCYHILWWIKIIITGEINILRILLITQEVVNRFLWIFWGVECISGNKPFDFGADPVHISCTHADIVWCWATVFDMLTPCVKRKFFTGLNAPPTWRPLQIFCSLYHIYALKPFDVELQNLIWGNILYVSGPQQRGRDLSSHRFLICAAWFHG